MEIRGEEDDEHVSSGDEAVLGMLDRGKRGGYVKPKPAQNKLFQQQPRRAFGSQEPMGGSQGVGDWEKHTKGIGAKLLKQAC